MFKPLCVIILFALSFQYFFACTGIRLKANTGGIIYARTLEFGQDIESEIIMIPQKYQLTGTAPDGSDKGLSWKSTYAVVGANALGKTAIIDGVNEKGLAAGLFYFPGYTEYQEVTENEINSSIASWQLVTWILTTCATTAEVKKKLPTITISNASLAEWHATIPVHAIVHDMQGASLVIEYVDGTLKIHDNPLGVITNAPTFEWHMTNLKNYVNISPVNIPSVSFNDIKITSLGQGSGMLGLPGDFTPPSRFVRAVSYSQSATALETEEKTIAAAFHILNLFDIPLGTVRSKENGSIHYENTQWTSACDLKNKKYYFHTYDNHQRKMVDLTKMNIKGSRVVTIPMQSKEATIDVTPK